FEERRIASPGSVAVLTDIMRGVVERGTGSVIRSLGYKGPAAGKTGTTDDFRDAWFVGFTPNLAVGVWTGFDDNRPTGLTGSSGAAPIWSYFLQCASKRTQPEPFLLPPNVHMVDLDPISLKRY